MTDEPGVRFGIAHAALVLAALAAGAAGLGPGGGYAVLVLVAAVGALALPAGWAAGLAVSAWAVSTGFLENTAGTLTLAAPDLARLAAAVTTTVLVTELRHV